MRNNVMFISGNKSRTCSIWSSGAAGRKWGPKSKVMYKKGKTRYKAHRVEANHISKDV